MGIWSQRSYFLRGGFEGCVMRLAMLNHPRIIKIQGAETVKLNCGGSELRYDCIVVKSLKTFKKLYDCATGLHRLRQFFACWICALMNSM